MFNKDNRMLLNKTTQALYFLFSFFYIVETVSAVNNIPLVTNVIASQRTDDSGIVDISYTLTDEDNDRCTVRMQVSDDGGQTWEVSISSAALSGDLGDNISPGRKSIVWNTRTDLPGVYGTLYRINIIANDNKHDVVVAALAEKNTAVNIDGNLNEWKTEEFISLTVPNDYVRAQQVSFDPQNSNDFSVEFAVRWTKDKIYLAAHVIDDIHRCDDKYEWIFFGDGIQVGLAPLDATGGEYYDHVYELGIVQHDNSNLYYWCWSPIDCEVLLDYKITRHELNGSGAYTDYELAINRNSLWFDSGEFSAGDTLRFSFMVNENDGVYGMSNDQNGREGWLEWSAGIGEAGKADVKFGLLKLQE